MYFMTGRMAVYAMAIFLIFFDRILKFWAVHNLLGFPFQLGGYFRFYFSANYNIAFSLPLRGVWLEVLVGLILMFLVALFVFLLRQSNFGAASYLFAVILGASSNYYDRLHYGYVIDYFDLTYFTVFNIADMLISVGTILLLLTIAKK